MSEFTLGMLVAIAGILGMVLGDYLAQRHEKPKQGGPDAD